MAEVEQQFRELPMSARQWTGPLFWLHGDESRERLEMYVGKVAEGGNGSFTAESRPHQDWLGPGWFRDLSICLEAAKKHGLRMWIFDEKWWPSGEVGGKVPAQYGSKRIATVSTNLVGPGRVTLPGCGGAQFIGAVAGKQTKQGVEVTSLVDISASVKDGALQWQAPPGDWKVMAFSWTNRISGNRYLLDGASPDCVDWYLRTVYQPHYDAFKADFGKTIAGYFYDEPETHGDWGTDVMKVLAERGVDWKAALVAWKYRLAGDAQLAAKYQYQDAWAEAWGRTLYGGITKWCEERGVLSIGHFLEHANGYLNQDICAGNMFPLQKYSSMGGLDAVFDQFVWGKRETRDHPVWQTPKLGSSITHAYGKPQDITMVEIYGARGQDVTYPEMKWWADHMQVSGVNFLIPHSFNPRAPRDTDCPPYFYNGGFEPRWPLYRLIADYSSRLNVVLSGGRHVCPVALLYLGGSAHVGRHLTPEQMSEALQDALYDCDWIPYEVFERDMRAQDRSLRLREEAYRILVVPPVDVIPYATMAKVKEFYDQGGVVVAHGFLPMKSADLGHTSKEIMALREAVWGRPTAGLAVCQTNAAGGRSYLLPEKPTPEQLQQVLAGDVGVRPTLEVLEGKTDHWLHVLHRVKAGRDVFFIVNQNHQGEARRFRFRATADGEPECWDPLRNELTALAGTRQGRTFEFELTMEPLESVLLVFQDQARGLPARLAGSELKATATIPIMPEAVPASEPPMAELGSGTTLALSGCSWVWYPEGTPAREAAPGSRFFRKTFALPDAAKVTKAAFFGSADNQFRLHVNGKDVGGSPEEAEGWRRPVELNVTALLQAGTNQLAIEAVNLTDRSSPAGLIGKLVIEFASGAPLQVPVDASWRAAKISQSGWQNLAFNDEGWPPAMELGKLGMSPWGTLQTDLTLSPVKADPFAGRCKLPAGLDLAKSRVYLEMEGLEPEAAARITVNDRFAGGVIGKPLRLDVTRFLQAGTNTVAITPFAPRFSHLAVYPR